MPRVPVRQIGTKIRPGWGLKVGTRLKCGQPFRLIGAARPRQVQP